MVPLQAAVVLAGSMRGVGGKQARRTIFLLEGLEKRFGTVVLGQSLNSRQRLTTVALCWWLAGEVGDGVRRHTLNTDVDVILGLSITNVVGERI